MNKTISINLGGTLFNIDDDAYQKLHNYLEAVRLSISDSLGREEILHDIELRISELLSEKYNDVQQIITTSAIDYVISIMGQPEAYRIDEAESPDEPVTKKAKKLYRDTNKGMIGGVCSGLSYYLGVDVVWLRILLLVMLLGFGTGVLAYIILWIAVPEAKTTAEKIEMTGEPVTISSIEKKVRAEFEHVAQRLKNTDYQKMENYAKTRAGRLLATVEEVLILIIKAIAKFIGIILVFISAVSLILILVSLFSSQLISIGQLPLDAFNYTNMPIWLLSLLIVIGIGLPLLALLLVGIKLLAPKSKSLGKKLKYSLIGIWILSLIFLMFLSFKQYAQVSCSGKSITKQKINCAIGDTISLQMRFNDFYTKSAVKHEQGYFTLNHKGNQVYYSDEVAVEVLSTDGVDAYIQVVRHARGKSNIAAKSYAEKLSYNYELSDNHIYLDTYFTTSAQHKYRGQHITVLLYLPKGIYFKPDHNFKYYNASEVSFFNLDTEAAQIYFVNNEQLQCTTCQAIQNEAPHEEQKLNLELDKSGKLIEVSAPTGTKKPE